MQGRESANGCDVFLSMYNWIECRGMRVGQFTYKTSHHGMFSDGKFSDRDGIFRDGRFCDGTFCMGTVVTVLTMGVQRNESG